MQNTTAKNIELIGQEPPNEKYSPQMPIYRAYGYTGKWSGKFPPPDEGTRVQIKFNGLGFGEVVNYFSEDGWLGIRVRLEQEPEWRKKQVDAGKLAMVFGAEISIA